MDKDLEWVFRCFLMHIYWSNWRRKEVKKNFSYLDSWKFICKFKNFVFWLILLDRRRPAGGSNPDHLLGVLPPSRPSQRDRSIQNHLRPPPSSTRKEISIPGGGTSGVTLSCALTSLKRELWSKRCNIASEKKKSYKFYWPSLSSDLKQIHVISTNSQREFSIHL